MKVKVEFEIDPSLDPNMENREDVIQFFRNMVCYWALQANHVFDDASDKDIKVTLED